MMKKVLLALMFCSQAMQATSLWLPDLEDSAATAEYLEASFGPYDPRFPGNEEFACDRRVHVSTSNSNFANRIMALVIQNDVEGLRETLRFHSKASNKLNKSHKEYKENIMRKGVGAVFGDDMTALKYVSIPPCKGDLPAAATTCSHDCLPDLTPEQVIELQARKLAIAKMLLAYGAFSEGNRWYKEAMRASYSKTSALHTAAMYGNAIILEELLKHAIDINVRDINVRNVEGEIVVDAACHMDDETAAFGKTESSIEKVLQLIDTFIETDEREREAIAMREKMQTIREILA